MLIQILYSVLVLAVNCLIYRKYNGQPVKIAWLLAASVYAIGLIIMNVITDYAPDKLLFFLIIFSVSIIILNFMMSRSTITARNKLAIAERMQEIKAFIAKKLIIVMITAFQLLLIWSPGLLEKMSAPRSGRQDEPITNSY